MDIAHESSGPWYRGITRYQWFVLLICSLGWIFDVFEGQLFVATMNEAMPELLPENTSRETIAFYNNVALGAFLVGGAVGGLVFGMLSDRIGRKPAMILSILFYSCFTLLTAFVETWWQMVALRFVVALGVAGEWAVATAMVAEVFPKRARAWSLAIFSASSVFGVYLAVLVGATIVAHPGLGWRWGFASGAVPALLVVWVMWSVREPEQWVQARQEAGHDRDQQLGRFTELFSPSLLRQTLVGFTLAAIGLGTYWGVHIYGRELYRQNVERTYMAATDSSGAEPTREAMLEVHGPAIKRAEMLGMFLASSGAGLGLLAFGPLSEWLGRRGAFLFFVLGGFGVTLVLFQTLATAPVHVFWVILPVFGFLTVGMNAGPAIYFPELFPTRVRATGTGFCFNGGRFLAASSLILVALMRDRWGLAMEDYVCLMGLLYLLGVVVLFFAPETKGRELPT